ncbi:MAG: MSMEG_0565 family glycosyltransferase [Anaerolineae bacterium]|nr:MSMEG_0565 family glycosyltransferase [Anaerolineae bacterium]
MTDQTSLRIALFTYSVKPRGGVIHTLALAEQLQALGHEVHIFALGNPGHDTFFRPTGVPFTLIPALTTSTEDEPLADRIQRYIRTYYEFLTINPPPTFDIYHSQDCISANALWRVQQAGLIDGFVRTIHHIDEFTSPALIQCQNDSIYRPSYRIVVSDYWRDQLATVFNVDSTVINNGVDVDRFCPSTPADRAAARADLGLSDEVVFLNIGGIEPRKNTIRLLLAFQSVRNKLVARGHKPVLILAGGETLFDYRPYRAEFFQLLNHSGLEVDRDIFLLGTVSDAQIDVLYGAADVFAFPSVKEGWGLVVLEAMAAGVPVLTSDLPVFREYLQSEENALLVDPQYLPAIAEGMVRLATDHRLQQRLVSAGLTTARSFGWPATAEQHSALYRDILANRMPARQVALVAR